MQKQLNISPAILPKIPQFWGSPGAAFAELVQNAVRAEATEIRLHVDPPAGRLTIMDNGRGIRSLDDFLTVGDSAWEQEVVEPAGMGFYAHLGYCTRPQADAVTVVRSRGRMYIFTPDCLRGAPVEIQPFDFAQDVTCEKSSWMVITIEGVESKVLVDIDFARMRPLPHPDRDITFTVNGDNIPNLLASMTPLETAVGTVYLRRTNKLSDIPRGVWEGLPVGFTFSKHQNLYGYQKDYVWWVDPVSGVRPRLPGREGFIQACTERSECNEAFAEAQNVIRQALETYCEQRAADLDLQSLPESVDWRDQNLTRALEKQGVTERVVMAWVKNHLYRPAEIFEGVWIPNEYGFPEYPETSYVRVRQDKVMRFRADTAGIDGDALAVLLNNQAGCWTGWNVRPANTPETVAFSCDGRGAAVEFANLHRQGSGYLADALLVGEQVVLEGGGLFYHAGQPVWVGDPGDILGRAADLLDLWAFGEYHTDHGDWGALVGGNNEFDVARLQRALAGWFDLGEDINLHNWLRRTRQSLAGWDGLPGQYQALFRTALEWAASPARAGIEQAVPALTLTPQDVVAMGRAPIPTLEELAEIARRVGENYREHLLGVDLPIIAAHVIENREEDFAENGNLPETC